MGAKSPTSKGVGVGEGPFLQTHAGSAGILPGQRESTVGAGLGTGEGVGEGERAPEHEVSASAMKQAAVMDKARMWTLKLGSRRERTGCCAAQRPRAKPLGGPGNCTSSSIACHGQCYLHFSSASRVGFSEMLGGKQYGSGRGVLRFERGYLTPKGQSSSYRYLGDCHP